MSSDFCDSPMRSTNVDTELLPVRVVWDSDLPVPESSEDSLGRDVPRTSVGQDPSHGFLGLPSHGSSVMGSKACYDEKILTI